MSEIARHPRPEKIPVPTGQLNAFLAVEAIRTALLTTTVAATELHTALDRERAGIVVVCAIRQQTAGGRIHRITKIKRLIESNHSPKSMAGGKNSARKSKDANGSSEGGEDIFPGCRKERPGGEVAEAEMGQDPLTKSAPR
jgi:hypothetical protein